MLLELLQKKILKSYRAKVGNEGYVQFVAKTALVEHYQKTINAKLIDAQRMYIDSEGAVELIKKYFPQED